MDPSSMRAYQQAYAKSSPKVSGRFWPFSIDTIYERHKLSYFFLPSLRRRFANSISRTVGGFVPNSSRHPMLTRA